MSIELSQSRVLVTGATGFIGRLLCQHLCQAGAVVTVLTRHPDKAKRRFAELEVAVTDLPGLARCEGFDAVVNLAGATVLSRWSKRRRQRLRDSRIAFTAELMAQLATKPAPQVLISGSAIGYYGNTGESAADESRPGGDGFAAELCRDWESQAQRFADRGTRVCLLRTGVVLDQGGGALASMLPAFKMAMGGPIAKGEQWMSWIHRYDLVAMILWLLRSDRVAGPVNAVAPQPIRNREFTRHLAEALHRPAFMRMPSWVLTALLGQAAQELLLNHNKVVPQVVVESGFAYRYPSLPEALSASV